MRHPRDAVAGRQARDGAARVARVGGPARRRRAEPAGATATFTAEHVVFAAGTYGTQSCCTGCASTAMLPELSPRLGHLTRTNSESLLGVGVPKPPAEGRTSPTAWRSRRRSSPIRHTHIEPVRYGKGSNLMFLLGTVLSDGVDGVPRYRQWARGGRGSDPRDALPRCGSAVHPSAAIIALVMQDVNNSITVFGERTRSGRFRLRSQQGEGEPNPTWIPVGERRGPSAGPASSAVGRSATWAR